MYMQENELKQRRASNGSHVRNIQEDLARWFKRGNDEILFSTDGEALTTFVVG